MEMTGHLLLVNGHVERRVWSKAARVRMGKPMITKETLKEIVKKTRIRSQNANARMVQRGVPLQMRMTIKIN
jgi:hypothetical protein